MKHTVSVTLILVGIFFLTQVVGLAITSQSFEKHVDVATGEVTIEANELPMGFERPQFDERRPWQAVLFFFFAILIGTILVLILARFRAFRTWKFWFFAASTFCLTVAFYMVLKPVLESGFSRGILSLGLAGILGFLKIYRPGIIIHNFSEIFIYGGLAAIFVPIDGFNIIIAALLLILISVYDIVAVFHSKHMVKLAKFQKQSVFAGFAIPYSFPKKEDKEMERVWVSKQPKKSGRQDKGGRQDVAVEGKEGAGTVKTAILGGGDIGFPLIFAGVAMKSFGFFKVLIIPVVVTAFLFMLLYFAQKDKFYPAMPAVAAGCFIGYGLVLLL